MVSLYPFSIVVSLSRFIMAGLLTHFAIVGFGVRVTIAIFEALCIYGELKIFSPPGALWRHLSILVGFGFSYH